MKLTVEDVDKISSLAQLKLEAGERERLVHQFRQILEYFEQLKTVPTEGVEPAFQALPENGSKTPMRPDEHRKSQSPEEALGNAPDRADHQFRVPRVID